MLHSPFGGMFTDANYSIGFGFWQGKTLGLDMQRHFGYN